MCGGPLRCPGNVKVHSGSPLRTYSLAAGRPRPVRSKELIDECTEETRHPIHPVRNVVARGRRRACATTPRPAIPGRPAGSATAPSPRSAARGVSGLQERQQWSAMQLYLTARRSGQRNMPLARRGQAACLQAEPSAGRLARRHPVRILPAAAERSYEIDARAQLQGVEIEGLQLCLEQSSLRSHDCQVIRGALFVEDHR